MKKLIISLTLGIAMMSITSCRWIHETFYSVEGCAEWYCEEMYEAVADNDVAEFIEIVDNLENWLDGLNDADRERANNTANKWAKEHETKADFVDAWVSRQDL